MHPLVLFIDDLQWIDPASEGVIAATHEHVESERRLVVHTYRPDYPWGLPGGWLKAGEGAIAGIERESPDPRVFSEAIEVARDAGLGITCHAGEWGGPAQVWTALEIDPWRVAHGAPAAEDAALAERNSGTELFNNATRGVAIPE